MASLQLVKLRLTAHARRRRIERGVTTRMILDALSDPECVVYGRSATVHRKGDLVVVVDPRGWIVTLIRRES